MSFAVAFVLLEALGFGGEVLAELVEAGDGLVVGAGVELRGEPIDGGQQHDPQQNAADPHPQHDPGPGKILPGNEQVVPQGDENSQQQQQSGNLHAASALGAEILAGVVVELRVGLMLAILPEVPHHERQPQHHQPGTDENCQEDVVHGEWLRGKNFWRLEGGESEEV